MGGDFTPSLGLLLRVLLTAYRVPLGGVLVRCGWRTTVVLLVDGSVACSALLEDGGELAIVQSDSESSCHV